MTCDDCTLNRQLLAEARAEVRHLEQVLAKRNAREGEEASMNKILRAELAGQKERVHALGARVSDLHVEATTLQAKLDDLRQRLDRLRERRS